MISPSLRQLTVLLELIILRTDLVMYCRVSFISCVHCFPYFLWDRFLRLEVTVTVYISDEWTGFLLFIATFRYKSRTYLAHMTFDTLFEVFVTSLD